MSTTEFFIELYSEEIPARMQKSAQNQFLELFLKNFSSFGIDCINAKTFITPKRMVFKAEISATTRSYSEEKRGPKENASEQALNGFLATVNLIKDDLDLRDGYYYAKITHHPIDTASILSKIIDKVLKQFQWPKVMRYPQSGLSWVRPIRSIVTSYNGSYLSLKLLEGDMETSNIIHGHKRYNSNQTTISSFDAYTQFLEKNYVTLDHNERQNVIKKHLLTIAQNHNLEWHEDLKLLEEVAGLVEHPFAFLGDIDEKFMVLPECVLITSMKVHQKYFAFRHKDSGEIAPFYCVITDYNPSNPSIMLNNFNKVLKARLSDALFFYNLDVKKPLIDHQQKFNGIIYQQKLGSIKDKIDRLKKNNFFKTSQDLKTTIDLCKTDLLTEMVGEFPELQGKMGRIYAQIQGQPLDVAISLEDYYLPKSPTDPLPRNTLACQLSLIDKMDAIAGFLGIGLKPTGSKDPYALRRQALGVVRILLTDQFQDIDLAIFIQKTYETFPEGLLDSKTCIYVFDFIIERFYWLFEKQFSKNIMKAVLSEKTNKFILYKSLQKIEALQQFLNTDQGENLKQLYKRCKGILGEKHIFSPIQEREFYKGPDLVFYDALSKTKDLIEKAEEDDYIIQMNILSALQPALSDFFRDVLVNTECAQTTDNRKSLLDLVVILIEKIADLKHII